MAMKGKMELTIGVAVGSSIQIAVGLVPVLVVVGWALGQDLTLFFEVNCFFRAPAIEMTNDDILFLLLQNFETIVLFVSVLLVNLLINDGKSNWLEGVMLGTILSFFTSPQPDTDDLTVFVYLSKVSLYFIIALSAWVS